MKLRKIKKFAIGLAAISLALVQFGCEQDWQKEYESSILAAANTLTVTIDNFTDSTLTVSYNMTGAGRVTLAVMPTSVDAPAVASLVKRSIDDAIYIDYFKHDDGNATGTITYDGLYPYTSYTVYGISHNLDGVASEMIASNSIRTLDLAEPVLKSYTPKGQDPRVDSDQPIVLTFSENVQYDNTKQVVFSSYFFGINAVVPEDSISIVGNVVTINYGILPFNDYCFVSYEEGAFADYTGNQCEAVVSGVIGGYLEGIWFRVEMNPIMNIEKIFDNFLGDYGATEYDVSDSISGAYGPYDVTISADENVEYGIIISNFFDVGADVKLEMKADGSIYCPTQYCYHSSTYNVDIWVQGYTNSGSILEVNYGHWDYTDYSINMSFTLFVPNINYWADVHMTFDKETGKSEKRFNGRTTDYFPFK